MRFVNVIDIDDNHHHRQREDHHCLAIATTTDIFFISEWMKELKHYIQYIVCSSSSSPLFHQILNVRKLRDTYSNFSSLCILLHDNNEEKTRLRYGMVFMRIRQDGSWKCYFSYWIVRQPYWVSGDENEVMIFFFYFTADISTSQVLDSEYKYATYFYYFLRKCISRKKLYGKASTLHDSVVVFTFILFLISSFRYGRLFVFNDFLWC